MGIRLQAQKALDMKPIHFWSYRTPEGLWSIRLLKGRWHALFNEVSVGVYDSAQEAVEDLAGGHLVWHSDPDSPDYPLPDDLDDWIAHWE